MPVISINGNELDPEGQRSVLNAFGLTSNDAFRSDYILIQTTEPLFYDQECELEGLGVDIHEYVSENTYLCGYKGVELEPIRSLPFVTWTNVYLDMFVIQSSLKSAPFTSSTLGVFPAVPKSQHLHIVDVLLHHDVASTSQDAQAGISVAARADLDDFTVGEGKIRLTIAEQYLDEVAAVDHVRGIHQVHPPTLFVNKAVPIINAEIGFNNDVVYEGEGQVIAIADTGFDTGSKDNTHSAFEGRVKKLYALGRTAPPKTDDPNGHGTHVCGSALGDGMSKSMGGKIRGVAPKASLVFQSLLDPKNGLDGIPIDLGKLFIQPYKEDNVRVHSNSWGSRSMLGQIPYNSSSEEIDRFVWENPDMVIVFAAGNTGTDANRDGIIDPKQIGSQSAAKNCITVGASENDRPDIDVKYGPLWPAAPIKDDLMANNPQGMAAFSSRGPTKEGRIKPDVVAPGTAILSARSRRLLKPRTDYGSSSDPNWWFSAGTSMAAPLVSGSVAVLRETLIKNGTANPSAALIKAILINGAVELDGQYVPTEAGPSPNNSSGFGLVNLKNSVILPSDEDAGWHEGGPLSQDQGDMPFVLMVPGKRGQESDLKVTLIWTDPPGPMLQNDLDLIVIGADGIERHGNMGTKTGFDRKNNVEQVVWKKIPPGETKILVCAYHIFRKDHAQRYAVVWSVNRPLA